VTGQRHVGLARGSLDQHRCERDGGAGAVPRARVGRDRSAVRQAGERGQGEGNDARGRTGRRFGDEADAAGIVFEARVVERGTRRPLDVTLIHARSLGSRSPGSATAPFHLGNDPVAQGL
jgi:hypothetical protein